MPILATVLLASQVAGTAAAPRVAEPRPGPSAVPDCVTVRVGVPPGRPVASRRPTFSARQVAEIELTARGQSSLAGRGLELRLFLPDGHLYQKLGVRDPASSRSNGNRRVPAGTVATARLPLAQTAITLSSLYGTWSVVPYLDGRPAACEPCRFVIRR